MPPTVTPEFAAPILMGSLVGTAVFVGLYVWYGWALARLFRRLGEEGWKGWVPLLNEVVILKRGGSPGWAVILYFVPIANLYGIYLKWVAMSRIGEKFGQGAGLAVVGVFLPPVWATILSSDGLPSTDHYGERIQGMMTATDSAPPVPVPPPLAPVPEPLPDPAPPAFIVNPWAPKTSQGEVSGLPPVPVEQLIPADDARANVAELSTIIPSEHPGILDAGDDELDRTVVVDRRPLICWSLLTEMGVALPLRSDSVLLGRKPVASDAGVELITVPDETRTLSKNHARLDLRDDVWTVTDLHSTNGVILVAADGSETLLAAGGSSPLSGKFILGNVSLRLVFENGPS